MDNGFKLKNLYDARTGGASYSVGVALLLAVSLVLSVVVSLAPSFAEKDVYLYLCYLLPVFCYMLPVVYLIIKTKTPFKRVYRGCKWYYFLLAVIMQFGLLSLSEANSIFVNFLRGLGLKVSSSVSLPSLEGFGVVGVIFSVALLPAISEETLFRGVISGSLKKFGTLFAVLICGALFSLFHQNPAQTIYQFVCGCAFALIAIKSGSILPTVLSHFLNNALIIILMRLGYENISFNTPMYILSVSALVVSFALLIFIKGKKDKEDMAEGDKKEFFLAALPGIAVCAVMWIAGLFV